MGAVDLGARRHVRPRADGGAHPAAAAAAELQPHDRGADGHDLHHRRVRLRDRAALRRGVHAEPGRRPDARRERGFRGDRAAGRLVLRRDGAREGQVLSTGSTAKQVHGQASTTGGQGALAEALGRIAELDAELARTRDQLHEVEAENLQRRAKRSRPELLKGSTRRVETPLGTMYVTVTEDDRGQPFEVFISLGKAGGALMADVEAIGRLISLALRSGIPLKEIYRQLRGNLS